MYSRLWCMHWFVHVFHILINIPAQSISTVLIRQEDSYAVYPAFFPCPGSALSVRFHDRNSNGLLVYSEDVSTGRFLSITLLPNRRLKIELELRLPQYRTTMDHVILMLDCAQFEGGSTHTEHTRWHLFTLRVLSHTDGSNTIDKIVVRLDGHEASHTFNPGIFYTKENSSGLIPKFGDQLFVGQLPHGLRKDATQRALFSAAMQPTLMGRVQLFMESTCVSESQPLAQNECINLQPLVLSEGSLWTPNTLIHGSEPLFCPTKLDTTDNEAHGSPVSEPLFERSTETCLGE
ncbi:unnamed protein product [Echinostoma caproni]|uniref:LAM_G_DOMAIN domain-containing protein n=1 Tax=Echinostoma caproni TaxID=27848 RepID=A0A183AEL0_9TREM|nr:unnamed protein product [Echinostoma caproni]